jgi:hypothetical protein
MTCCPMTLTCAPPWLRIPRRSFLSYHNPVYGNSFLVDAGATRSDDCQALEFGDGSHQPV